jgi:CRP-like cAMP-binding protein
MERVALNGQRNRILASMSKGDLSLMQRFLKPVELNLRKRLQASNRRVAALFFPETGLASMVAIGGGDRRQAEVAVIGRDGMTGLPLVLGTDRSPCEIFMQVAGEGLCISAGDFRFAVKESDSIMKHFLRYSHVLTVQGSYTALANARGNLQERLARWLLMAHDRTDTDELFLTHEFLSLMLGVRRAGVTVALREFVQKGLIEAVRGSITIHDRDGLEECANGFYGMPESEFERLFAF